MERFAPLRSSPLAPLVVCKVKRLYIGIVKDIIVARRRFAPLVVCKYPKTTEHSRQTTLQYL